MVLLGCMFTKNNLTMKNLNIFFAVLGGAAVGATLALLFAPEKGEDMRSKIARFLKEKGLDLKKDKMDELVDEIAEELQKR